MNRNEQLEIFRAQVENVRELEKAWIHLNRTINRELVENNFVSASVHTKSLVLVFSAWSEANFGKLIHTPHGFELWEIEQIKRIAKFNITEGWKKCLELGLRRIDNAPKSSYVPNINLWVSRKIDLYVQDPSLLRNKIAHGQWAVALNRENDAINRNLTNEINEINVVTLSIWKEAYLVLSDMIEFLIESPQKAFQQNYQIKEAELKERLRKTDSWTLEQKIKDLKIKRNRFKHDL